MNARTVASNSSRRPLPTEEQLSRRLISSCVYAAALAVLGCTASGLEPVVSGESGRTTVVAGADVQLPADYDAHLGRIRAADCFGLGARVGTRGACLVIIEHHIDGVRESYYDPQTKALVAEYLDDPMSNFEGWTLGDAECAGEPFVESEYILCGGP